VDYGKDWTLDIKKGPWRSETEFGLGTQFRFGMQLDPSRQAGNATLGAELSEKLSYDIGNSSRVYGRGSLGIQTGVGTRFEEDEPLNAFTTEWALGVEHRTGPTLMYGEPFYSRVQDLSGELGHSRYGARLGVERMLSERDFVQLEGSVSQYQYTDGQDVNAYGVRAGYQRRDGKVWWGPEVGFENRDNGDNKVFFGVRVNF
jgi:hypothetical protein